MDLKVLDRFLSICIFPLNIFFICLYDFIEKVNRYVYLDKTVTQAGDLLPEIKTHIALR